MLIKEDDGSERKSDNLRLLIAGFHVQNEDSLSREFLQFSRIDDRLVIGVSVIPRKNLILKNR